LPVVYPTFDGHSILVLSEHLFFEELSRKVR
jgi:hypothetical protein